MPKPDPILIHGGRNTPPKINPVQPVPKPEPIYLATGMGCISLGGKK